MNKACEFKAASADITFYICPLKGATPLCKRNIHYITFHNKPQSVVNILDKLCIFVHPIDTKTH